MKKSALIIAAVIFVCVAAVYAGTTMQDVIEMNSPGYDQHKKPIVKFSHKKHIEEYGAGCGECHHNDDGEPLDNLKAGDDVQKCIECHDKPGRKPRKKSGEPAPSGEELQKIKLQYHADTLHLNCNGCHKKVNRKSPGKAPTSCAKCHLK